MQGVDCFGLAFRSNLEVVFFKLFHEFEQFSYRTHHKITGTLGILMIIFIICRRKSTAFFCKNILQGFLHIIHGFKGGCFDIFFWKVRNYNIIGALYRLCLFCLCFDLLSKLLLKLNERILFFLNITVHAICINHFNLPSALIF